MLTGTEGDGVMLTGTEGVGSGGLGIGGKLGGGTGSEGSGTGDGSSARVASWPSAGLGVNCAEAETGRRSTAADAAVRKPHRAGFHLQRGLLANQVPFRALFRAGANSDKSVAPSQ
jgi:hypothetical protein